MAKPAFQQYAAFIEGDIGFNRDVAFTFSTAPLEGDVIYVFATSTTGVAVSDPADWTNVLGSGVEVVSDAHSGAGYAHRVTGVEAGASKVTWTLTNFFDSGTNKNGVAVVYRDVDPGSLFDDADSWYTDSNSTSSTVPVLTPTVTDGTVIACVMNDAFWDAFTIPENWTARGSTAEAIRVQVIEQNAATVAAVNTPGVTISGGGGDEKIVITLIAPPVPPSPPTSSYRGWGIPI